MNGTKQELSKNNSILIRLDGGASVRVPRNFNYAKCRSCPADDIVWAETLKNKKPIPIRWDEGKGWITHFSDCPNADKHRKK